MTDLFQQKLALDDSILKVEVIGRYTIYQLLVSEITELYSEPWNSQYQNIN